MHVQRTEPARARARRSAEAKTVVTQYVLGAYKATFAASSGDVSVLFSGKKTQGLT